MLKRISGIMALMIMVSLLSISVFATDADKDDGKSETETAKPIITITRPSSDGEKVFSNKYTIAGIAADADKKNIRIELFKKNSDGSYNEFKAEDGQSAWDVVGQSGFFSFEVKLTLGYMNNSSLNNFKIKAYDKANPEIITECYATIRLIDPSKLKSDSILEYSLNKYFKPLK
jgi:hypothetical protein